MLETQKKSYYSKFIEVNIDSLKKTWNIINKIRNKKNENKLEGIEVENKYYAVTDNAFKIAEEFNKYLKNVPNQLLEKNKFSISNVDHIQDLGQTEQAFKLENLNLEPVDVEKAIYKLKNKNSAAWDKLSSKIFKNSPKKFAAISTPLMNKSLKQGEFDSPLQLSVVFPQFKQCDQKGTQNYRPIHNLPVIST